MYHQPITSIEIFTYLNTVNATIYNFNRNYVKTLIKSFNNNHSELGENDYQQLNVLIFNNTYF